ncbi:MAG: ATP synthase F0 subunit C [Verrucomicrobia bacterium]|nr:ATP synthase F0 subunit C [Verrucomicrobiota bacterium]
MELPLGGLIALAAALVTWGAGLGIGKIGVSAMDGIARQPEAANNIRGTMIIACALIEGVAFFCAVIALIAVFVK